MGAYASRPSDRQDRNEPVPPPQPPAPAAHDPALVNAAADVAWQKEPDERERQNPEPAVNPVVISLQQDMLLHWKAQKQQEHNDRVVAEGIAAGEADHIVPQPPDEINNNQEIVPQDELNLANLNDAPKLAPALKPRRHTKKKLSLVRNRKTGACCVKSVSVGKDASGAIVRGKPTVVKGSNNLPALISYSQT